MSSDSDLVFFHNSIDDDLKASTDVKFNDKNYTFITDSTSNSGSFSSGQIQFDLATLNSQSQWINLNEAVIEFPVKISTTLKTACVGGTITNTVAQVSTAIIKNGWHQWIDSCQVIINGQNIQSAQPYENVAAQFRIISKWSQDELVKYGPTCGFALDDCTANGDTTTTISSTIGLSNAPYSTIASTLTTASYTANVKGLDVINNQATLFNKGITTRNSFTNNEIGLTTSTQATILGASAMKTAGRNNSACTAAGSNTATDVLHTAFYMATCRLKDLCDISNFPMVKNLKGFIYLSFNSSTVQLTGTTTSAVLSAVSITPNTGRTTPFLINTGSTGIVLGIGSTTAPVVTISGSVDATTTGAIGSSGPVLSNARLLVPYYIANPKTDSALTISNKFFTTLEKIVNPLTVPSGQSINYTISTGIPNAKRLVMLPMWQNLGAVTNLTNPEISPFDSVPATSGPFAVLSNLQVYLANKPMYQYPIQYDYEQWVEEQEQLGLGGSALEGQTSGLLSQLLFNQNHRFYSIDLSRRIESEDGSSKSVQVSFTNPSSTFGLKVICIVFYEKQWIVNTGQCQLSSV